MFFQQCELIWFVSSRSTTAGKVLCGALGSYRWCPQHFPHLKSKSFSSFRWRRPQVSKVSVLTNGFNMIQPLSLKKPHSLPMYLSRISVDFLDCIGMLQIATVGFTLVVLSKSRALGHTWPLLGHLSLQLIHPSRVPMVRCAPAGRRTYASRICQARQNKQRHRTTTEIKNIHLLNYNYNIVQKIPKAH